MRVLRSILLAVGILLATGGSAWAQPAPLSAADRAFLVKPRGAVQVLVRGFLDLQDSQRRGPSRLLTVPPVNTGNASRRWLPEVPLTLLPPGMAVGPVPFRAVGAAPAVAESANTMVASARGNDGMLMGLTVGLPWRIP